MKKRTCLIVLGLCLALTFTACAGKEGDSKEDASQSQTEEEPKEDEKYRDVRVVSVDDVTKYIKLGTYKGIELQKTDSSVSDEVVDAQVQTNLTQAAQEVGEDEPIQNGDIANIDYTGKVDGKEFEGGSAKAYDLTIGSGSFIAGFEDGLVGAKKGETKDLQLKFPEDYQSQELAGKDAVFTVTVNSIKRAPELTEDWVKKNSDYKTVEEYQKSVKEELEKTYEQNAENQLRNEAWGKVVEATEVLEYPQEDIDAAIAEYKKEVQGYADQQDMELEEFVTSQGMTVEQLDQQAKSFAEYKVKQDLVIQGIMDAEGLNLADKECSQIRQDFLKDYQVDNMDTLTAQYGEATVNESVGLYRVMDLIIENAEFTDAQPQEVQGEDTQPSDQEGGTEGESGPGTVSGDDKNAADETDPQ